VTATWFALRKLRPKPEHWQMSSGRRPSVCSPAVPRWLSRALRGAALGAIAGAALVVLIVFLVPTLPIHVPRGSRGAVLLIACLAPTIVAAIIGALIQQSPPHGVVVLNADSFVEPERLVLRPSTAKWLLILLASITFVAVGLLMVRSGGPMPEAPIGDARFWGWFAIVFFGLGIPLSLAFLVSPHFRLLLSPRGFTFGTLVGTRSFGWADVHSFRAEVVYQRWPFPPAKQVRFSYAAHGSGNASVSGWRQLLAPASGGRLLDTYGMTAEQLAAKMNSWQRRYSS